jgi:hypothetical protein
VLSILVSFREFTTVAFITCLFCVPFAAFCCQQKAESEVDPNSNWHHNMLLAHQQQHQRMSQVMRTFVMKKQGDVLTTPYILLLHNLFIINFAKFPESNTVHNIILHVMCTMYYSIVIVIHTCGTCVHVHVHVHDI